MTTRLEAAARAICGYAKDDEPCEDCNGEAAAALAASDAVLLSDATVERAARALDPEAWDETVAMRVAHGQSSEVARTYRQRIAKGQARAVLAAAMKEDGE